MKLYKWALALAIILIVALFAYPRLTAHAEIQVTQESTPEDIVALYAAIYNVDIQLSKKIVSCESKFNPKAKNPSSTASGLYQFLQGSWTHYSLEKWGSTPDVFDARYNAELGAYVLSKYGTSPWTASKDCWDE